jgi:hypothetical protein
VSFNLDTKTAIKSAIDMANMISTSYLGDLTDDDMMHRPSPGCNHIKWQVGHLIVSENNMISQCLPEAMPALPEGFSDRYTKETAGSDNPDDFDSKATLMKLYREQRTGTLAALESIDVNDLSNEGPEPIRSYCPTIGAAFLMQDAHWMMHAGQWAVVRRQLGREPLF